MSLSNLTGVVKLANLQVVNSSKHYQSVKGGGPLTNHSQMTPARMGSNSTGRHDSTGRHEQSPTALAPDDVMYIKAKHVQSSNITIQPRRTSQERGPPTLEGLQTIPGSVAGLELPDRGLDGGRVPTQADEVEEILPSKTRRARQGSVEPQHSGERMTTLPSVKTSQHTLAPSGDRDSKARLDASGRAMPPSGPQRKFIHPVQSQKYMPLAEPEHLPYYQNVPEVCSGEDADSEQSPRAPHRPSADRIDKRNLNVSLRAI